MNEMEVFVRVREKDKKIVLSYNMCGNEKHDPNNVDTVISLSIGDAIALAGALESCAHKLLDSNLIDRPAKVLSFTSEGPHHQREAGN